jgi:hypothetical protein
MEYHQLACPYCAGEFSAAAAPENRTSNCPHCDREVTVPAATPSDATGPVAPASSPPPPPLPDQPTPVASPPRRLSPAERARIRRRLNVGVAIGGMAILAIALLVLLRLRP